MSNDNGNTAIALTDPETTELFQIVKDVSTLPHKLELLDTATEQVADPARRRELRENFSAHCLRVSIAIGNLGKYALWKNIKDGSWTTARDRDGNPYESGLKYFLDWWQTHVSDISIRTAYADFSKFEIMSALGVSAEAQRNLIGVAPHISGNLIQSIVEVDDRTGEVVGLNEGYRNRIADELGLDAAEAKTMSDAEIAAEFLEEMAGLGRDDMGALAQKILREWKFRLSYRPAERVFVIEGWQAGNEKRIQVFLSPLKTEQNAKQQAHPEWKRLLNRLKGGRLL